MIERKQIVLIKLAMRDLRLDDATYRSYLRQWFDVESSKDLSYEQASTFIDELKKMGFKIQSKKNLNRIRKPLNVETMLQPEHKMLKLIERLKPQIEWYLKDGYERFTKRVIGKEKPLTTRDAYKVIEGLKALQKKYPLNNPPLEKKEPF